MNNEHIDQITPDLRANYDATGFCPIHGAEMKDACNKFFASRRMPFGKEQFTNQTRASYRTHQARQAKKAKQSPIPNS